MASVEPEVSNNNEGWQYKPYDADNGELPTTQAQKDESTLIGEEEQPSIWNIPWASDDEDAGYDDEENVDIFNPVTALSVIFGSIATAIGVVKFYDWFFCIQPRPPKYLDKIVTRMTWQEPEIAGAEFPFWRMYVRFLPRISYHRRKHRYNRKRSEARKDLLEELRGINEEALDRDNMQRHINLHPISPFARSQEALELRRAYGTLDSVDTQAEFQPYQ